MSIEALQHLIDALPVPVLLVGPDERIAACNGPTRALFPADMLGRHYITALRQPAILDLVEQCQRDGVTHQGRYLGIEGQRDATWRITAAAVRLSAGRGVLLTCEDMTAVEEAGKMRRDFVTNVSHELRTPLTALLGFVETLRGAAKDDPVARDRFLLIMEREAGRMSRLVADLLSLSRVEEDERVRPMAPVDIPAMLEAVIATLEPVIARNGVTIALNLPQETVVVPGDPGQLRQVFINLIENAIKYGGRDKTVTITLTAPAPEPSLRSDGVSVAMRDEGEGIAAHHIPRLTERFYRVDSHRSREEGGTGLGLAIVKHIVNRHRGRLRIESEPGRGSCFTVVLPVS